MLQLACELGASIRLANDMLRKTGFLNTFWEHVKDYPVSGHMAQRCQNRIMPSDGKVHPTLRRIEGEVEHVRSHFLLRYLGFWLPPKKLRLNCSNRRADSTAVPALAIKSSALKEESPRARYCPRAGDLHGLPDGPIALPRLATAGSGCRFREARHRQCRPWKVWSAHRATARRKE